MNDGRLAAALAVLTVGWAAFTFFMIYVAAWSLGALLAGHEWWADVVAASNLIFGLVGFGMYFVLCRSAIRKSR